MIKELRELFDRWWDHVERTSEPVESTFSVGVEPACTDPDVLTYIVLRHMISRVGDAPSYLNAAWGGVSEEELNQQEGKLIAVEAWTKEQPDPIRKAYKNWIDHYYYQIKKSRRELKTHTERNRQRKYMQSTDALFDKVTECMPCIPAPPDLK